MSPTVFPEQPQARTLADQAYDSIADAIVSHGRNGGADILGFAAPVGDWVIVSDTLVATAGCDRRFSTCRDRFANAPNFRGFPHIPGNDFILRYPRTGQARDGRALVK